MRLLITSLLLLMTASVFAQDGNEDRRRQNEREKLQSARIAFLSARLQLDPETAQKFWPIFNEYESKKEGLSSIYNEQKRDLVSETGWRNLTDENANKMLDIYIEQKQAELNLEKRYLNQFREVLDTRQVWMVIRIDSDFRRSLMRRLSQEKDKNPDDNGNGRG